MIKFTLVKFFEGKKMIDLIKIEDLNFCISEYKNLSSKKSFITKEIKAMKEHLEDLKRAYQNRGIGNYYGWLHGERIFLRDIKIYERNILIVQNFRNNL